MTERHRQQSDHRERQAHGADLARRDRPGVPMEHEPRPGSNAHGSLARQPAQPGISRRRGLRELTPVFGTAQPLRGVSGAARRFAYSISETRARHWMLLLLADRLEVLERRAARALKVAALVPAAAGLAFVALRLARR